MATWEARLVHVTIDRPWQEVYAFASTVDKMPLWAAGLASGLSRDGDDWIASGPLGDVHIRFTPPNILGVIDHVVTLPDGLCVHNALRVTPNADGAEVTFTALRLPGMSDTDFARDIETIGEDLNRLKSILEDRPVQA